MASIALGVAGAAIGNAILPGLGGSLGWALGSALGAALFPQSKPAQPPHDLHLQGSSYGVTIKWVYGKARIAGVAVWQTDEQEHTSGGKGGGKSSGGGQSTFTASFDIVLCETKVKSIKKIWAGGRLNYDFDQGQSEAFHFVFYDGEPDQLPDPSEEAKDGAGDVPAYRGVSRIVVPDKDMTQYGNTLPQYSALVVTAEGPIPFRVSFFDAVLDPSAPYNMNGTYDEETAIITVGAYIGNAPVTYSSQQFMLDGTPVGGVTGPDNLPNLAGVTTSQFGGGVSNLQACYCYHAGSPAVPNGGWYVGTELVAPVDLGGGFSAIHPVYSDGYIFAAAGNIVVSLNRWIATDGVPTSVIDATVSLGTVSSNANIYCSAADGFVFVTDSGVVSGASIAIWKFDQDLNLIHAWAGDDLPPFWKPEFSKFFYKGMVVVNGVVSTVQKAVVYKIEDDFTFTLVGDIDQNIGGSRGPEIQLKNGLILSLDGVISIDPPDGQAYVGPTVADLCEKAGVTAYDVTVLNAIPLDGYVIEQQTTCRSAVETLMPLYFFDAVERDGVIVFVVRGGPSIVTFEQDDLAAHTDNAGLPALLSCVHTPDADLPSALALSSIDPGSDYQISTQIAQRMTGGSRDVRTVSANVVLTPSHAKKIVDAWLYNTWSERDAYTWFTSRKYAMYEPTDVVTVMGKVLRITKKTEGATGVIQWDGVPSNGANFDQIGIGGSGPDNGQTLPISQLTDILLLDIPLLNDADAPNGIYAPMAGHTSPKYAGGALFKSFDGSSYTRIAATARPNTMGVTTTALPNYAGANMIDTASKVRIAIGPGGGTLSSCTFEALLNGENEMLFGLEIAQPMTLELISAGVYDASNFLRGRRGTEWAQRTHVVGERFVAFDPALPNPAAVFAEIGQTEYYKAVTVGKTLASATAQTFANTGQALKPYSPTFLGGGCDASGNKILTCLLRTRIGGGGKLVGPKPLSETAKKLVWQMWDSSYTICGRIIQTTTEECPYSAANELSDFGSAQRDTFFTVGQVGAVSIGAQSRGSVPGTGVSNTVPLIPLVPYSFNPVVSPPPPPGGGRAVNHVFTWPDESIHVNPLLVGSTWVGQFTTGAGTPSGVIAVAEYQAASEQRHCFIATDSDGLNKVPRSESWGTTASSFFGPGNATLLPSTTYFFITDFIGPDGNLTDVAGFNAAAIIELHA